MEVHPQQQKHSTARGTVDLKMATRETEPATFSETLDLHIFLEKFAHYFQERADTHDIMTVTFCLQQLFMAGDLLYTRLLPELTLSTLRVSMPQTTPQSQQDTYYTIWTLLQETAKTLTRLEPLCHLLIGANNNLLEALDRSCCIRSIVEPHQPYAETTEVAFSSKQTRSYTVRTGEWHQIYAHVITQLNHWQLQNKQRLSFAATFANVAVSAGMLTQADSAFDLLLESLRAIFSDILPDFQTVPTGDDETTATLLLDLIQKADQQLLQIGILIEPFHSFTRQYARQIMLY